MGEVTANKPFEVEVRFSIPDIEYFRQRVEELGCELIKAYAFTDRYYKPLHDEWSSLEKTMRIREWSTPDPKTLVYFSKQEVQQVGPHTFKRSVYPQGKVTLLEGKLEQCQQLLHDLGFEHTYSIQKKRGWVWKHDERELEFCAEETDLLGWSGEMEIEGTDSVVITERIRRHQELLGLGDEQLSYKPIAVMIEEKLSNAHS